MYYNIIIIRFPIIVYYVIYRVENRAVHTGCAESAATISIGKGFFGTGMCGWIWDFAMTNILGVGGVPFPPKIWQSSRATRRTTSRHLHILYISHSAVKIYNNNIYGLFSIAVPFGVRCERRARVAVVGAPDEWFMTSSVAAPKPPPSSPPPYINATYRATAPVSGL